MKEFFEIINQYAMTTFCLMVFIVVLVALIRSKG